MKTTWRHNIHQWDGLFTGDTCKICWKRITVGTAKANHAKRHVRQGKAVLTGEGTTDNPFGYKIAK